MMADQRLVSLSLRVYGEPSVNIQNQPRVKNEVGYQHECRDQYQPECRARRAAQRLVLIPTRVLIPDTSASHEVGLVFIIPSSI